MSKCAWSIDTVVGVAYGLPQWHGQPDLSGLSPDVAERIAVEVIAEYERLHPDDEAAS